MRLYSSSRTLIADFAAFKQIMIEVKERGDSRLRLSMNGRCTAIWNR